MAIESPYNPEFVQALKSAIPYSGRQWDGERRIWRFDRTYGDLVAALVLRFYGRNVSVPVPPRGNSVRRKFRVEYIGGARDRGDGFSFASGFSNGAWSLIFPEQVLRDWFGAGSIKPGDRLTYYAVLGLSQSAEQEEVKKAYKRLARQWHPDMNQQDPDAPAQFRAIKEAFDILSNPDMRKRYDIGLTFESLAAPVKIENKTSYRSPLKCGDITMEGEMRLERFVAEKILAWDDIVERGRVMCSVWSPSAQNFEIRWYPVATDYFD